MGGKFAVINEGNLRYCIDSVTDMGNYVTLIDSCIHKAAFYIFCISTGHGLLDYNKRTAYQVAYVFLLANGFEIHVIETDDVVLMMRQVSTKRMSIESVKNWVAQHIKPISS
jgi:death-on-curing family protein